MSESATNTAERGDSEVHQESDKQMVEGEKEAFWRNRYIEADAFAHRVETDNHDLRFQVELLQKQLDYADERLDKAIDWWRKLEK